MNTAPKELSKQLKEAIEKFDLSAALTALEKMETDDVVTVLDEKMTQPGAYQIRGNRSIRNTFYDALLSSSFMSDKHNSVLQYANEINETIKKIEKCFDEIRNSLPQCAISQLPKAIQFWSHVELASRKLAGIESAGNKEWEKIEAKLKAGIPTAIPEALMIPLEHGRSMNVDTVYGGIVEALSLTLKMLSFEQKLLHDGKLVAPAMPAITDEHVYKAGAIQLYAASWNALENAANRTLFFNGDVGSAQDAKVSIEHMSEAFHAKFSAPIFFYRELTEVEVYDFMANRRLHTWAMQNTMLMANEKALFGAVMKEGTGVPELTSGFVSKDEAITLTKLSEILSYDVFKDQERFHGLTLREWVRGYCALGLMAAAKQDDCCLVTFEKSEIEQGLRDYKLPEESIPTLIHHLTFGQDSRDLYDSPLIHSEDGKYTLFANVLKTYNLTNVLFSRLSSLTTQFDKKGKGFESRVVSSFVKWGYPCESTKFNIDGAEYEYDALVLIDDTLLLIECKNNLLSSNNAVQAFRYSESIDENIKQIKRLERGLRKRPDIIQSLFHRKLDDLTLVPVILNSMTYSREPVEGVYISDWSALSKFFTESTISRFGLQNGKKIKKQTIHTLWKGKRPTARELLDYLTMPIQLQLMSKFLRCNYFEHPMSESSIFFSQELDFDEEKMLKARGEVPLNKKATKKKIKTRRKKKIKTRRKKTKKR
ncbi:hypothetical protein [Acinetobacter baumannii]|uniref:hypothetical protein n=1 Tax=Acinetobacter baumannii TaxID=470 RepID=UPI00062C9A78|nr:hypothetical protein [Acinetobacter baumannii]KKZ42774.1 hypothetical protein UN98_00580 [Acinetobacter baumannii]